jgi:DNA-directed RNA polymerase subunit RPC12/RpoP
MSESPVGDEQYDVVCPHCKKPFRGRLLSGSAARYHGFKCPHCKLFVPFARTPTNAS